MSAPVNAAVSFDKSTYNPGDTITATITWQSGEAVQTITVNFSATISNQNGEQVTASATFEVATDPTTDTFTAKVTDDGNRDWTVSVDPSGTSATATATA